jgi:hypothetical protein
LILRREKIGQNLKTREEVPTPIVFVKITAEDRNSPLKESEKQKTLKVHTNKRQEQQVVQKTKKYQISQVTDTQEKKMMEVILHQKRDE